MIIGSFRNDSTSTPLCSMQMKSGFLMAPGGFSHHGKKKASTPRFTSFQTQIFHIQTWVMPKFLTRDSSAHESAKKHLFLWLWLKFPSLPLTAIFSIACLLPDSKPLQHLCIPPPGAMPHRLGTTTLPALSSQASSSSPSLPWSKGQVPHHLSWACNATPRSQTSLFQANISQP